MRTFREDQDLGQITDLGPEDRFCLSLEEIASSGYCWEVINLPECLKLIGDSHRLDNQRLIDLGVAEQDLTVEDEDPEVVGAASRRVLVFEVVKAIEKPQLLNLIDWRSWSASVARRHSMAICQ